MPYLLSLKHGKQGDVIKAEDLINRLWLSNPSVIPSNEIADIGLTRLISGTISNSLPNSKTLKQLDDKFQNYARENNISEEECARIAMALSERTISNLKVIDELVKTNDNVVFAEKLNYAMKESERHEKIKEEKQQQVLEGLKSDFDKQLQQHSEESKKQIEDLKIDFEKRFKISEKEQKKKEKVQQKEKDEKAFQIAQEFFEENLKNYKNLVSIKKSIFNESNRLYVQHYSVLLLLFLLPPILFGILDTIFVFIGVIPFLLYFIYLIKKYGLSSIFNITKFKNQINQQLLKERSFNIDYFKELETKIAKTKNIIDGFPTILVEGISDEMIIKEALKLFANEYYAYIAVRCGLDDEGGTTWLKEESIHFIRQANIKVISLFDDDLAGNKAYEQVLEELNKHTNSKVKISKVYGLDSQKPRHITDWWERGVKLPISLEEMYSFDAWQEAEKHGWLEDRTADELIEYCKKNKQWNKNEESIDSLKSKLRNENQSIYALKKIKDKSKVPFAKYITNLSSENDKKRILKSFETLILSIAKHFDE
jgi:hypothetical protein